MTSASTESLRIYKTAAVAAVYSATFLDTLLLGINAGSTATRLLVVLVMSSGAVMWYVVDGMIHRVPYLRTYQFLMFWLWPVLLPLHLCVTRGVKVGLLKSGLGGLCLFAAILGGTATAVLARKVIGF